MVEREAGKEMIHPEEFYLSLEATVEVKVQKWQMMLKMFAGSFSSQLHLLNVCIG